MNLKSNYLLLQAKPTARTGLGQFMACGHPGSPQYGSPEFLFAPDKLLGFLFTRFSKKTQVAK